MTEEEAGDWGRGLRPAAPAVMPMLVLISAFFVPTLASGVERQSARQARSDPASLLAAVIVEVEELGRHPGEDFYRWEFFLGEDDDDTNKDIHAVVIIHEEPPPLRLRIYVTDLERLPGNPRVRIARKTRTIFAARVNERLAVEKCDYPERELVPVLTSLLKAIRDKKRLLRRTGPLQAS